MGLEEKSRNGRNCDDFNVLVFVKNGEKYVFLYDDSNDSRAEILRMLGRFASDNSDLSLEWSDAAELAKIVGNTYHKYPFQSRFNSESLINYDSDRGYCFLVKNSKLGRNHLGIMV
ncbi:hypothetical protein GOV12_06755 [Candidatus Pacearchaeota archaeon]|nr:hypothetical protein [Candidatus Pacearchaeota archaeon]